MELQKPMQLYLIGWEKFLGDSTEVLQAVHTGGVFYVYSGIPFFGGVGIENRATEGESVTFITSKLNRTQSGSNF